MDVEEQEQCDFELLSTGDTEQSKRYAIVFKRRYCKSDGKPIAATIAITNSLIMIKKIFESSIIYFQSLL